MRVSERVRCDGFPCPDVKHECYAVPSLEVDPVAVGLIVISEAAAPDPADDYYAAGTPLFARTTVEAFNDAGASVASLRDLLNYGVYFTTAVKCAKTDYGLETGTVRRCSLLLAQELDLFPNVRALLCMGDVAIKAINAVAKQAGLDRVMPAGATYKIRGREYCFRGARVFPSYLQAGPSFYIEKGKRRMIAEDIAAVLRIVEWPRP